MANDENRFNKIPPSPISKNKNIPIKNVVTPDVKILNRGDLLGAINCLFPELQLKSSHIKLKEEFSLFSYSLQELTRIFESGRKYRTRTVKKAKCSLPNQSMRINSRSINSALNIGSSSTKNIVSKSSKIKARKKQHSHETEPSKRYETVQFQSHYTDFVNKFLESRFPDRFADFKNIECVIQELHNLLKEISKEHKIGPFNPNLPVLNISECDMIIRLNNGPKKFLKTTSSPSIKNICNMKKIRSRSQIEIKCKGKKSVIAKRGTDSDLPGFTNQINCRVTDDSNYEDGRKIIQNIEDVLSDDTFSPRYKAKHSSDRLMISRKTFDGNDSTIFNKLEKEAIEQYENVGDAVDMNFNLLEIET